MSSSSKLARRVKTHHTSKVFLEHGEVFPLWSPRPKKSKPGIFTGQGLTPRSGLKLNINIKDGLGWLKDDEL